MDIKNLDITVWMILRVIKESKFAKNIKIQKIIYIYEKEAGSGIFSQNFFPYDYGPFSKQLWEVIDMLLAKNCIIDDKLSYKLTERGSELFEILLKKIQSSEFQFELFNKIVNLFKNETSDTVIKYVYNLYKEDINKSIIVDGLIYEEDDYEWIRITKKSIDELKSKFQKN